MLHRSGRGTDFSYAICYDSSIWSPPTSGSTTTWTPNSNFGFGSNSTLSGGNTGYITYLHPVNFCYIGSTNGYPTGADAFDVYLVYHDPWGIGHVFPGQDEQKSGSCGSSSTSTFNFPETAPDGSGFIINGLSGPIVKPDGTIVAPPVNPTGGAALTTLTDRNGNQMNSDSSGHFYDTLSSTTPILSVTGSGTTASPTKFTYTAPSGASPSFTISYVYHTVATNFAVSGITEKGSSCCLSCR